VGTLNLGRLFQYPNNTLLTDLANNETKIAEINDELNDLVYFFKQYALAIIPVVNKNGKLIGSVSIDNMIYIIEESTESDIWNLTGVRDQDTFDTVIATAKHRFLWLFMNLLIAFMTALVINNFTETIIKIIALASIMPIVASMGGNAGTQVMTVTVRALSKKDINRSNIFRVILKEIAVCEFNAFWLSCIGSFLIILIYDDIKLSAIFGASVMINFFIAGMFGALIPITLDHMEVDPATASSVFLTALTDGFGFFTFLGLSYLIM
jgi:magnesium transporter